MLCRQSSGPHSRHCIDVSVVFSPREGECCVGSHLDHTPGTVLMCVFFPQGRRVLCRQSSGPHSRHCIDVCVFSPGKESVVSAVIWTTLQALY